jgi:glycogen operon protein
VGRLKLIAEPWDLAGTAVGAFAPGWSEWNDRSRDDLRRFCLARDVGPGALADRLAGSSGLFRHDGRNPLASINFVTCHDGFTLDDLVTYEKKRNAANGEDGRDGNDSNHGWNAGVEGTSDDPAISGRREDLKRLLLAGLIACKGVPMLAMGDEMGHSQDGNNNAWCQDNPLSWLDWGAAARPFAAYVAHLLKLRRDYPMLSDASWLDERNVAWLSLSGGPPAPESWRDPTCRTLGIRWRADEGAKDLLGFFNAGPAPVDLVLPSGGWAVVLDSAGGAHGQPLAPFSARFLAAV